MEIRCHTGADYSAIAELRWLLKTNDGRDPTGGRKKSFFRHYLEHLEEMDQEGRTAHWLADDDGFVVGAMTVRIVPKEPSPGKKGVIWGYLTNSFVVAQKRDNGIGTRILEAIKIWAIETGLELLIVWPSDASYSLYRRAGFKGRDDPLELMLDDK